jgi:hypothetical protein
MVVSIQVMKQIMLIFTTSAVALVLLAAGCATSRVQQTETTLTASGFKTVSSFTPEQQRLLNTLPAHKLSTVKRKDQLYYVYPDHVRHVAYVGTKDNYQTYLNVLQDQQAIRDTRAEVEVRVTGFDDNMAWDAAWPGGW